MALKWTTTAQEAGVHGVKMLVYADAGAGKTLLTATAPRPVLISAESGLLSLRAQNILNVFGEQQHISYDIPTIVVSTIEDLNDAYDWCANSQEAQGFDTIALDSLTEIGEVVLAKSKAVAKDPRQAYGELIDKMTTLVKGFRDLSGKHVYMSAKQEYIKDEVTGISKYGPSMPGTKLGPSLPYLFDEVFYLGVGLDQNTKLPYRYIQTTKDLQYTAKDRSGALDAYESPDLTNIITKIIGGQ